MNSDLEKSNNINKSVKDNVIPVSMGQTHVSDNQAEEIGLLEDKTKNNFNNQDLNEEIDYEKFENIERHTLANTLKVFLVIFLPVVFILLLSYFVALPLITGGFRSNNLTATEYVDKNKGCKEIVTSNSIYEMSESVKSTTTPSCSEIIKSLDDKYSVYFTKDEYNEFSNSIDNTLVGLGVVIQKSETDGSITIVNTLKDINVETPAKKNGIAVGDIILTIDGQDATAYSTDEASKNIRGKEGTQVLLTLKRGSEILTKNVTREKIKLPNHRVSITNNILFISIYAFSPNVAKEITESLKELKNDQFNQVVLDLRDNPGGYLDSAKNIVSFFAEANKTFIVEKTKETTIELKTEIINTNLDLKSKKVLLIANQNSASASEVVVAALSELKGYKFAGKNTYGKGVVQSIFEPSDDDGIFKLTTAYWLAPSGKIIDKKGIAPDIEYDFIGSLEDSENIKKIAQILAN